MSDLIASNVIHITIAVNTIECFFKKIFFASSASDIVMKEVLKLNSEEAANLNFYLYSHKVTQKYLTSSTTLDFEVNDMLDDAHQEIMDMHFQDAFDAKCKKIIKYKIKFTR